MTDGLPGGRCFIETCARSCRAFPGWCLTRAGAKGLMENCVFFAVQRVVPACIWFRMLDFSKFQQVVWPGHGNRVSQEAKLDM